MARTTKKADAAAGPLNPVAPVRVSVTLAPSDDTSVFYINTIEVAHTINEFAISCTRFPTKLSRALQEEFHDGGPIEIDATVQLIIPPTLMPSLIRTLILQKENYEAVYGPIKDPETKND